MAILHITSDYPPNPLWGMGWHVYFLVKELEKNRKIYVATAQNNKSSHNNVITTNKEINKKYLSSDPYEVFDNYGNFILWQKELAKEIIRKDIKFNIVHCHNWMSWTTTKELKKAYPSIRIVSTFHLLQKQYESMIENPIPSFHEDIINTEKEMIELSDFIIIQSQSQFNLLKKYSKKLPAGKIKLIYSGIKNNYTGSFKDLISIKNNEKTINIIFVGRIELDKGIDLIIETFVKLLEKFDNIRLHIFGKGSKLLELKKKFEGKYINFHGYVGREKLEQYLIKSHIYCLPSTSESFGNTVVEAMSFGVVPIVSSGDTMPDLFTDKVEGLKVPLLRIDQKYQIDTKNLYNSIKSLIIDTNKRTFLLKNAFQLGRNKYSIKGMAKNVNNLYEELLK